MSIPLSTIQSVVFALRFADREKAWVVLVCPEGKRQRQCRAVLAGAVPDNAKFSGRTARLPSGGVVSVTTIDSDLFVPDGTPYYAMFVGWQTSLGQSSKHMSKWYTSTSNVLRECAL